MTTYSPGRGARMRESEQFWMPYFLYGYQKAISDFDLLLDKSFSEAEFPEAVEGSYTNFQASQGTWTKTKEGVSMLAGYYCMLNEVYKELEKGDTSFSACEKAKNKYQNYAHLLKPVEAIPCYGN